MHTNTSWDAARFETCAHRWLHVGEPGYGVAVANDSTYGHDVTRTTREDGGTTTTVRLSLLRAPRFPDPETDQGEHRFRSPLVGAGIAEAVDAGYRINLPLQAVRGDTAHPVGRGGQPRGQGRGREAGRRPVGRRRRPALRGARGPGEHRDHGRLPVTGPSWRPISSSGPAPPAYGSVGELADGVAHLRLRPFQLVTLRFSR